MNISNVARLDEHARFHVREDRGDYESESLSREDERVETQILVGDALNLAGLLLKSLEDDGDTRAMQIEAAVRAIEEKLEAAFRRLG